MSECHTSNSAIPVAVVSTSGSGTLSGVKLHGVEAGEILVIAAAPKTSGRRFVGFGRS